MAPAPGPPDDAPEKRLSPLEKGLLAALRRAGRDGLEPRDLRYGGAAEGMERLDSLGLAVTLEGDAGPIHWSRETYLELQAALLDGLRPGDLLPLARAKERTALSRKYLLPLLRRLERDGFLRRREGEREVVRLP